jgi:hypothetical protein
MSGDNGRVSYRFNHSVKHRGGYQMRNRTIVALLESSVGKAGWLSQPDAHLERPCDWSGHNNKQRAENGVFSLDRLGSSSTTKQHHQRLLPSASNHVLNAPFTAKLRVYSRLSLLVAVVFSKSPYLFSKHVWRQGQVAWWERLWSKDWW